MSENFSTISKIDPEVSSTWAGKVFLTFDIDWAHNEILKDTLNIVEEASMPVAWFVTHSTPVLNDIRAQPSQELGLHPNFNPLMDGVSNNSHDTEDCEGLVKYRA